MKRAVTDFLGTLWRSGALPGTKQQEAYFVAVGRQTMTEDDIVNGRLILEIGVAPIRPAEFIVLRIALRTQEGTP